MAHFEKRVKDKRNPQDGLRSLHDDPRMAQMVPKASEGTQMALKAGRQAGRQAVRTSPHPVRVYCASAADRPEELPTQPTLNYET